MPNNWTQQSQHPKGLSSWPRIRTNLLPVSHPHSQENTLVTNTFLCFPYQGDQTPCSLNPTFYTVSGLSPNSCLLYSTSLQPPAHSGWISLQISLSPTRLSSTVLPARTNFPLAW